MCPCLCKCQREEVSVKSADPSVAVLCVSTRMSGEPLLLESVSLCVRFFFSFSCEWQRHNGNLVLCP